MKTVKRIVLGTAAVIGVFSAATLISNLPVQGRDNERDRGERNGESEDELEVQTGFSLVPPNIQLNLKGKDVELVGLGSYIVNAQGACNDCHTCPSYVPGHSPSTASSGAYVLINGLNYLAGGVHFGPFMSRNITPDIASGKPAGLSLEEFQSAIRTGHDPDDPVLRDLLQVMPWPIYRHMTGRDLDAIYTYLSALPHAEPGACSGAGQ